VVQKSYLYCFITIVFFSTLEVVGKIIGGTISPIGVTAFRFAVGGMVLLPFAIRALRRNPLHLTVRDIAKIALAGSLNVAVAMLLLQFSIFYGKASLSAIVISGNPIFVALFGWIILKERLNKLQTIGAFVGLIGLSCVILAEPSLLAGSRNLMLGAGLAVAAALSFGLYTVLSKKYVLTYGIFVFNSFSFFAGAMVLLSIAGIFRFPLIHSLSVTNVAAVLYLGIFVTGFAYYLFFEGLKNIPTALGSMFFYLKPFIASVLAVIFLHEHIFLLQIAGVFIVIGGMNLNRMFGKKQQRR
jgi:drug/metabolite transporter (DMT)-like permease